MISPDPSSRLTPSLRVGAGGSPVGPGNDAFAPRPVTDSAGAGTVEFDFDGVQVGTAEYPHGPTGVTVILLPAGSRTAVDQHGAVAGVTTLPVSDAICLAGGSTHGFAAGTGVAGQLPAAPAVNIAVIDDFAARTNAVHPDAVLGRAAWQAARPGLARYGRVGAGRYACAGKVHPARAEFAGQGVAFREIGAVKVLVVTVVNSLGVIIDRTGRVVRGNYDAVTGTRRHPVADYAKALFDGALPGGAVSGGAVSGGSVSGGAVSGGAAASGSAALEGSGTLTVVVTNVRLSDRELARFGRQVHASLARAIQPFHTDADADVLFAVTTDEINGPRAADGRPSGTSLSTALASVAAEAAWDAVLRSTV